VDFIQNPAFTTADLVQAVRFGAADQVAAAGATLTDGSSVPADSAFVVRFAETMNASTISAKTFRIRKSSNGKVKLIDGNPVLLADGVSVLMVPAEPLDASASFEVVVKGGPKGVASTRGVVMAQGHETGFTTALAIVSGVGLAE
jgi:hypothetical protein